MSRHFVPEVSPAHCGGQGRNWSQRRCPRCALDTTLAQLRTEGDPHAVARRAPLLARLEQHDKPRSALAWLERSPAAPTLRAMLRDEIAISHEALDEHDVGQATDHLRSWLASRTTSSTRATFAHAAGPRPVNSARYVFLDPHARAFYADWDRAARDVAAILRYAAGRDPYDRDLSDLVGELSTQSEEFRSHWAAQNVRLHDTGVKDYHHPVVGDITLTYNRLDLSADEGLKFTVWTAEPGSKSAEALNLLGSWAATLDPASPPT